MKRLKILIALILILYKYIYKSSFVINILIALFIFFILFKLIKNQFLKNSIKFIFILGLFILSISLSMILNDISKNRNKKVKNNYVIVLGAGLNKDKPTNILKNRLNKAIDYYHEYPTTIFIVSGGLGKNQNITESYAMKSYLNKNGVPLAQIIEEDKSTSTFENLIFSKTKIPPNNSVGVISNDFHLYRAKYFGNQLNLNLSGIYAKTPFLGLVSYYLRESIAITYYFINNMVTL